MSYGHHITDGVAATASGWAGALRDPTMGWEADYGAVVGLRARW